MAGTCAVLLLMLSMLFPSAGNAIQDRLGLGNSPQTTQASATVTWSDFTPAGWVTSVPTTSTIVAHAPGGLSYATAAYATSTDGGSFWSKWSTAGLTIGGPVSTTQTITVTGLTFPDAASADLIVFGIQESGGISQTSPVYIVRVDTQAPAAPQGLRANPAGWTKSSTFTVTWTNPPDVSGIAGAWYKLDSPPTASHDGIFVATTNSVTGIQPSGDGAHPIYVWLQDETGQADYTRAAATTLYVDQTAPSPPYGLRGNPARTWTRVNNFAEQWTNPLDPAGITGVYYRLDRVGQFPTDGTFVSTTMTLTNIQVPSDGKHTLYLWLVDGAGNTDQNNRNIDVEVFWYDSAPPVSTAILDPPLPVTGWYSTAVTVLFTANDGTGGSGVETLLHQLDGAAWDTGASQQLLTEGKHHLSYYAKDIAGNLEANRSLTLSLDFTPPAVSLNPQRPPQPSGWYTAPVTLELIASDALSDSAVGYFRVNGAPWQPGHDLRVNTDGQYRIDYYAQDGAGNQSAVQPLEVLLDSKPPATAYKIDGTQGQNGWFVSPLAIHLIPTDDESGVAATYYRINNGPWQTGTEFRLDDDGIYSLLFYSVDRAGNTETSFPVQVKVDTAPPNAPSAVETTPATCETASLCWSRVNRFSVQWANPTDLSGITGVYYRMDGEPTASDDGVLSPYTNRLDNLTVPTEGAHRLYLWLRDAAGNADHHNRTLAPLLRYDATPPTTTLRIGGLAGTEGWYRSPITVTLEPVDVHSGVAGIQYRLDDGPWTAYAGTSLSVAVPGKHVLRFTSEDAAGNVEATQLATLRIDPDPPAALTDLRAEPAGWQSYNSFRLLWQEPTDQSGVAGAYVRFDTPPSGPTDGTFYRANEILEGLQVPGEGKHGVYVWLRDRAGNSDQNTAVRLSDALWYDGAPPVTAVTITGILGDNGWYRGPVTFAMTARDTASGLREIRWQIDGGMWNVGDALSSPCTGGVTPPLLASGVLATCFLVDSDGQHVVRIASADNAGNVEPDHLYSVPVDQQPPQVWMASLSRYHSSPRFDVNWMGSDPVSGMRSFDVQVRDGTAAAWEDWLTNTTLTTASFRGQRGHAYYFRVRARDLAGNQSPFTDGNSYTVVETLVNGSFDVGNFTGWTASGLLYKAVVPVDGPAGDSVLAARLGTPDYGPSIDEPGQVPVGYAMITQTVTIPSLDELTRPMLTFRYRVFTYDVLYSESYQRFYDSLDVALYDVTGQPLALLLRDGNTTSEYGKLYDTGWRLAMLDLRPYAGLTVQLVFANYNRNDNRYNTWSFVDDIQVPESQRCYLPAVDGARASALSAGAAAVGAGSSGMTPPLPAGEVVEDAEQVIPGEEHGKR
jgi:hypothetical protein